MLVAVWYFFDVGLVDRAFPSAGLSTPTWNEGGVRGAGRGGEWWAGGKTKCYFQEHPVEYIEILYISLYAFLVAVIARVYACRARWLLGGFPICLSVRQALLYNKLRVKLCTRYVSWVAVVARMACVHAAGGGCWLVFSSPFCVPGPLIVLGPKRFRSL